MLPSANAHRFDFSCEACRIGDVAAPEAVGSGANWAMGSAILDAPQASGAAYSTAPPVTERNKFPYRSLDLAAARGEQTRTLLPFCYHFIALIAAAALLSSLRNMCA